jgi:hypothetical protein
MLELYYATSGVTGAFPAVAATSGYHPITKPSLTTCYIIVLSWKIRDYEW